MGDHAMLVRLQAGEGIPLAEFTAGLRRHHAEWSSSTAACSRSPRRSPRGEVQLPAAGHARRAPMTIAEKILAAHVVGASGAVCVKPGDAVCVRVDGGYSHEFTTAQVHYFLEQEYGAGLPPAEPREVRGVRGPPHLRRTAWRRWRPFSPKIQVLRDMQRVFQQQTGVQDYSARDGVSPGICHTVARERIIEPGDFIQATDSHTCMGGAVQRARLRRRRDRVRGARALRLHLRRGARVDPLRAARASCGRASPPRT